MFDSNEWQIGGLAYDSVEPNSSTYLRSVSVTEYLIQSRDSKK